MKDQRLTGIALMVAAMLVIPLVDGAAKYLSAELSPLFIAWARYACAILFVLPATLFRHGRSALPRAGYGAHILRTLFLVSAMTLYFLAIARIPLATAMGTFFVSPVIATLLASLILKERLTGRRIFAAALAFSGAMLILRPGLAMETGTVLALGAGFLFAGYMIATRMAARASRPLPMLLFQCLLGAAVLFPQALYAWGWPSGNALMLLVVVGALSAISHVLSIAAFRYADASTLAPFIYVELIGITAVGYFIFAEIPGPVVWAGIAIIVTGGLIILRDKDAAADMDGEVRP